MCSGFKKKKRKTSFIFIFYFKAPVFGFNEEYVAQVVGGKHVVSIEFLTFD